MANEDPIKLEVLDEVVVDEAVRKYFPNGSQVVSSTGHGASFWTRTARVDLELTDGSLKSYFLKLAQHELGRDMLEGEFNSQTALYGVVPDYIPKPIAWGTYLSDPTTHFFLCAFHEMGDDLPEIEPFCRKLAELHRKSIALHTNPGKYGFHITTHQGQLPQDNRWCDRWEDFYIQGMKRMLELEEQTQRPSEELKELSVDLYEKVIPRLLRPLETGGRSIKPCLVHGDLWYGNAMMDLDRDEPVIFDACAFWAHNEYEIGTWRPLRYRIGRPYMREYHKHFPISAPEADWDDRNALYAIRFNLHASALYPSNQRFRLMVLEEVRRLVKKYPDGYAGFKEPQGAVLDPTSLITNSGSALSTEVAERDTEI